MAKDRIAPKRTHGQTPENRAKTLKKYNAKPEVKKKRAGNNKARALMMKKGKVRKGDGKDVHHKNNNPLSNRMDNLIVQDASKNRSFKRNSKGGHR